MSDTGPDLFAHCPRQSAANAEPPASLVVDLEGYEGPIDVLLTLAREQKVDLTKISILKLAEQYLAFISEARRLRLEIAADYLVMAAWLAYLKSRLLLPEPEEPEDEPTGEELAAALAFQLQRLQAMQEAGARLMALPQFGRDVFGRGAPEGVHLVLRPVYELTLYELLKAYGEGRRRAQPGALEIRATELFSMDDILARFERMLGRIPEWRDLASFLPPDLQGGLIGRSALAATFAASLELARSGRVQLRQDFTFGPIYLRSPALEIVPSENE
jgi:segregation and condensation protein A